MADFCKCRGDGCAVRALCKRYTAAKHYYQCWFVHVPGKDETCPHYWPTTEDEK